MSKDAFLQKLKLGLKGLPPQEIEEIVGDYSDHFTESAASGRQESEVASALGDPARLARELRADAGLRRFERHWTIPNMLTAVLALGGLAVVDTLFLLPFLLILAFVTFVVSIALFAIAGLGLKFIFTATFFHHGISLTATLSRLLVGACLVSAFVGGGALLLLAVSAGIRLFGHYTRLHFHLAQPTENPLP